MFTSFSVLLAAFSVLISTPGFATNQTVQQQALALIPQIETVGAEVQSQIDALATPTTTQTTVPAIGGASQPVYVAPVQVSVGVAGDGVNGTPAPSCTVSVDYLNSPASVSWNVQNGTMFIPSLQWRYTNPDGTWGDWNPMAIAPTYVPDHDPSVSVPPETTQQATVNGLHLLNDQGSSYFKNVVGNSKLYPIDVQLGISGVTCDYTIK